MTKTNIIKLVLILIAIAAVWTFPLGSFTTETIQNQQAVATVNGGNAEFVAQQATNVALQWIPLTIRSVITVILAFWGFFALRKTGAIESARKVATSVAALSAVFIMPSCMKPYQEKVYTEVKPNETAFVIPLEGDSKDQAKLASAEFLESKKVAAKRIEVPTRWLQTGRLANDGKWIPTVRVIVVDRAPITRSWEAGVNGTSQKDEAIWVESSDSVGFCMGFNCTAFIKEEDTSTFLYWYSSGSLSSVMDTEIRGRIQQVAAEEAAKLPLDSLRDKKNEIALAVRKDIVPFFEKRGITITTVGMFGGMTYENPNIQKSIDNVFVAQQEKNVALAKFETQKKENERIVLQSQGEAQQLQIQAEASAKQGITKAEAEAKQRLLQSDAEAKAISSLNKAVSEGGSAYLQLKTLEVQAKQYERWNGQLPTMSGITATPFMDINKIISK